MDRKRILVAEDDTESALMLLNSLGRDYALSLVDNGMDLYRLAMSTRPGFDLIISDVVMPCGEGNDVIQTLRGVGVQTPVILVSGHPDVVVPEGVTFLEKPLDLDALATKVALLLNPA